MQYKNFGDFLHKKRREHDITLRGLGEMLSLSAPFLTDVEKGRRSPLGMERLEKLENILDLTKEERDIMFDLAGKDKNELAPDLPEYVLNRAYIGVALRKAKDVGAGEAEWMRFIEDLENRTARGEM